MVEYEMKGEVEGRGRVLVGRRASWERVKAVLQSRFPAPSLPVTPKFVTGFRTSIVLFHLDGPRTTLMADPSWQEQLRLRLLERNARESSHASIIEQCRAKNLHLNFPSVQQAH